MKRVVIYSDGACRGNPGPGGWGAILEWGDAERVLSGAEADTTNNRMELKAAIEALRSLKRRCLVDVYTDSEYLRRGVKEWLATWKRNGWKTSARKPVKNIDLWQELDELAAAHDINWHWVKGHSGHPGNERADRVANEAIDRLFATRGDQ